MRDFFASVSQSQPYILDERERERELQFRSQGLRVLLQQGLRVEN